MRQPEKNQGHETDHTHPAFDYRPPRYMSGVKWAAIVAGAVSLVCALYVAFWFFMAGQVRDGTTAWIDERRNEGFQVNFKQLDIGGFPFNLHMTIVAPSIAAPASPARWGWEGEKIRASMRPWRLGRVTVDSPGSHAFVFTQNGGIQFFQGQAEQLRAQLNFGGEWPTPVALDIAGLTVKAAKQGDVWRVGRAHLDAIAPKAKDELRDTPTLEIRLRLGDVGVPARLKLPLGADIERLEVSANLVRPIAGGPLEKALGDWRDDGGAIEVPRLSLAYGPLLMNADGTIALDGGLQPIGSFTARIEGFFETVDALRKRGIMKARDAVTAKIVLGVMARRNESGRTALTVPLTVQERRLFTGPVPLAEIPEIIW
ncbi:MAG: DUF2125 domain-containing protein [Rhodospirillales bacterium]|jgi:hypothetical protein|nr:DUF2125 domain-containing protein [Rhodospirillales bacterium]